MYEPIFKRIICFFTDHRWNWVNGDGTPDFGATCFRCGKVNTRR